MAIAIIGGGGAGGGGATSLNGLVDVDATGPSDLDVLTFDQATGRWVPRAPTSAPSGVLGTFSDGSAATFSDGSSFEFSA